MYHPTSHAAAFPVAPFKSAVPKQPILPGSISHARSALTAAVLPATTPQILSPTTLQVVDVELSEFMGVAVVLENPNGIQWEANGKAIHTTASSYRDLRISASHRGADRRRRLSITIVSNVLRWNSSERAK